MRCSRIILHHTQQQIILRSNYCTSTKLHCLQPYHYLQNQHIPNYAKELKQRLRITQQVAKSHTNESKINVKLYADKDTNTKTFKTFKIGDKVLLQDKTLRRGRSKKLEAPWTDSYRVTEKISDVNYKIQIKRKTICAHTNQLKPFVKN